MKLFKKTKYLLLFLPFLLVSSNVYAATSPNLGAADSFSVLSGSYINTSSGTTLNGDLGYTTGPAVSPTVSGNTFVSDSTYNQAGIDQATALSALNSQACTFNFSSGPIDLATDTTHGTVGIYAPGVYCATGAVSVGTGGITLTGAGTYIFRMNGALTTVANSVVSLAGGASACTVWWTPTAATTLGANTTFAGTIIDPSGITIGNTDTWTGRALAFGGTVTTSADTINTVPNCAAASVKPPVSGGTGTSTTGASGQNAATLSNTGLPILEISAAAAAILLIAIVVQTINLKGVHSRD